LGASRLKKNWKPVIAPPVTVDIVGECHDILAVSKPVGMDTIQISGWTTGYPSLKDVVYPEFPYARFLNRIDRNTSGLVLFALTKAQRIHLANIWFGAGSQDWRKKIYLAIISEPNWDEVTNDNPLKKEGRWEDATTKFTVVRKEAGQGLALVTAELHSHGRTHQIRKHLQELGYPIVGDTKYGGRPCKRRGQLLHAWINEVRLANGTWVKFQSQVPEDFPIRVEGGSCLRRIPVAPLTEEEQLQSWELYNMPKLVELPRKEGEAYPDYVARREDKQRRRGNG